MTLAEDGANRLPRSPPPTVALVAAVVLVVADAAPFARTFAVGQAAGNGSSRLQPFRLDEGLRSWEPLAQRVLDRPAPK